MGYTQAINESDECVREKLWSAPLGYFSWDHSSIGQNTGLSRREVCGFESR